MLGLRTTIYKVSNLSEAKEWYSKAFKQTPYFDENFYVGFNIGGFELGLLPENNPSKKTSNVLAYWGVADIKTTYQHLLNLGATIHETPKNVDGEILVGTVLDLWGNILGIIFNPAFKISK